MVRQLHQPWHYFAGVAALLAGHCCAVKGVVLPRSNVVASDATFYVYKDDVVLFPISFSIPKERILPQATEKTAFLVNDSWKSFQIKRYRFGPLEEEAYYSYLQWHRFGDTRRKGGFDCLRHYELLASGCVPILQGLEDIPSSVLTTLPRPLLRRAKELYELAWENTLEGPGTCPSAPAGAYEALTSDLLAYTAEHLSTESAARYILDTLNIPVAPQTRVLFLPCAAIDNFPAFLTASVFHGLVSLLGDGILDVPEYEYMYRLEGPVDPVREWNLRGDIWGQGYTLGFKLPRRPHLNRLNISERIRAREFDLIIFGRMSPYDPCNFWYEFGGKVDAAPQYLQDVYGRYPKERVALLYPDDSGLDDAVIRSHVARLGALHRGLGIVFMRELLPFVSEGPEGEALRPVDTRILQPGCFEPEWLDFFEFWPERIRPCARWGQCDSQEVADYLQSSSYKLQYPPDDPPVLQHFCRTGFALKAAFLVQLLGPEACMRHADCAGSCTFTAGVYLRNLFDTPAEPFHSEFGVSPAEVVYVLSVGCKGGRFALQPALAQERQVVASVLQATPATRGRGGGLNARERQAQYLLLQGFTVLVAGNSSADALQSEEHLQAYADYGRLKVLYPPNGDDRCTWQAHLAKHLLLYLHLEMPLSKGSLACLESWPARSRPSFVSVQLPGGSASPQLVTLTSRVYVTQLVRAGYTRFKASNADLRGVGMPIGEWAPDLVTGQSWRSALQVLDDGLRPGQQVHAAL